MERSALRRLAWLGVVLFGCGETHAGPPEAAPRGVPVQVLEARQVPVEDAAEYIATMDSRRAVELLPQVDGRIRRIFVKSGETVAVGTPIVEIDPREQQAEVAGAEEQRRSAQASLTFARRQYERMKTLFDRGAVSQQDLDQARANLLAAEANVAALGSRVRAERVQLKYFTVTAPFDGVVGDVRTRVGERVTSQTPLTTIDQLQRLQVYVYVPGERAPRLKIGMPLAIVDTLGEIVDTGQVDFVSPRIERDTQTVLVKSTIPNEDGTLRQAEAVRARLVFGTEERVVVPIVAVTRLGAQTFAFIAERQGPGLVARRRPIDVGGITGNDYVVLRGVAPGELIIVSGTQKLADGTPVETQT
jgi:RND family efflux transporter MFP subunit